MSTILPQLPVLPAVSGNAPGESAEDLYNNNASKNPNGPDIPVAEHLQVQDEREHDSTPAATVQQYNTESTQLLPGISEKGSEIKEKLERSKVATPQFPSTSASTLGITDVVPTQGLAVEQSSAGDLHSRSLRDEANQQEVARTNCKTSQSVMHSIKPAPPKPVAPPSIDNHIAPSASISASAYGDSDMPPPTLTSGKSAGSSQPTSSSSHVSILPPPTLTSGKSAGSSQPTSSSGHVTRSPPPTLTSGKSVGSSQPSGNVTRSPPPPLPSGKSVGSSQPASSSGNATIKPPTSTESNKILNPATRTTAQSRVMKPTPKASPVKGVHKPVAAQSSKPKPNKGAIKTKSSHSKLLKGVKGQPTPQESEPESEIEDECQSVEAVDKIVTHKTHYSIESGCSILYQVRKQTSNGTKLEWIARDTLTLDAATKTIVLSYEQEHESEIREIGLDMENYDTVLTPRESELYEEVSEVESEDEANAVFVRNGVVIENDGTFSPVREPRKKKNRSPKRRFRKPKETIETVCENNAKEWQLKQDDVLLEKIDELIQLTSSIPDETLNSLNSAQLLKRCKALSAKTQMKYVESMEKTLVQKSKQNNLLFHQCQTLLTSLARHKTSLDEARTKLIQLNRRKHTSGGAISSLRLRAEKAEMQVAESEKVVAMLRKQVKKLLQAVQQQHKANKKRAKAHKAAKVANIREHEKVTVLKEKQSVQEKTILSLKEQVDMLTGQLKLQDLRYDEMRSRLSLERKSRVSEAVKWKAKVERLELVNIKQQIAVSEILAKSPTSVVDNLSPKQHSNLNVSYLNNPDAVQAITKSKRRKKRIVSASNSSTGSVARTIRNSTVGNAVTVPVLTSATDGPLAPVMERSSSKKASRDESKTAGATVRKELLTNCKPYVPQPHRSTRSPVKLPELGQILKW